MSNSGIDRPPNVKTYSRPQEMPALCSKSNVPRPDLLPKGPLVRAVEQPPGNDLRLDFGGSLENIQDAGVAQDARDRKFKRKAVTAMHLHRIVGSCPSDPRGEQFRHASLEIATAPGILLTRRIICELARDHDFHCHHNDLVGHAWEADDRAAKLRAVLRVAEGLLHRRLCDADSARCRLNAGGLERLHQLLEPEAFASAKQILGLHLEAVEGNFIFLHAAI